MTTIVTFGTFDLFHFGHLMILKRAADLGDRLVVGVSSDRLNYEKKETFPIYPEEQRRMIVESIRYVDETFIEESLELKDKYIQDCNADILVMGDDWAGKFDHLKHLCDVVYLPRTKDISTTYFKSYIAENL